MKLRILFFVSVVMLPLMSAPSYAQSLTSITETDIHTMLNGIDRAARRGNVAGMIAPLAPDIKIKMRVLNPGSDQEEVGILTKDDYESRARNNMRRKLSYQVERKNTRIKIYDNQTAMVTCEVYETLKMREGTLRSAASAVYFLALRDGKLVITSVDARMRVY